MVGLLAGLLMAGCGPNVEPGTAQPPPGAEEGIQPTEPPQKPAPEPPVVVAPVPPDDEPEARPPDDDDGVVVGGLPPPPKHFKYPPLQTTVEQYTVEIDPKLLALFYQDRDTPLQPAVFITPDGRRFDVQMRLRGNSSRGWPKKSWRIEFPEGVRFDGRHKLNLISQWRDSTMMIEKLGFDMLEAMGVPAPRGKYVHLVINGQTQGAYLDLERVDKNFLRRQGFADTDGTIYRCGGKNCEMKTYFDRTYQRTWEKKTNETQPDDARDAFLHAVNHTPEPDFIRVMQEKFELEHHLRYMAVDSLITNSTVEDSRSYVVIDAITGRLSYVPWDFNNSDAKYVPGGKRKNADFRHPIFSFSLFDDRVEKAYLDRAKSEPGRWRPLFSNINTRIVLHPELRERVLAHLEQGLAELLSPEVFDARVDAIYQLIAPYMQGAPHTDEQRFADGPRYLKQYARNRTQFIQGQVDAWRGRKPGLVLRAVNAQEGWLELHNLGKEPVSTAGLVLTTDLRDAMKPNVPARTLQPGETLRLTEGQLGLKLKPEGEVGLFNGKSVVGVLDALFYGELPPGRHYARSQKEPLRWVVH